MDCERWYVVRFWKDDLWGYDNENIFNKNVLQRVFGYYRVYGFYVFMLKYGILKVVCFNNVRVLLHVKFLEIYGFNGIFMSCNCKLSIIVLHLFVFLL